jgi:hypothetical protein
MTTTTTFLYHSNLYDLVKSGEENYTRWSVYETTGAKCQPVHVLTFTNRAFDVNQAEHMARTCLLNFDKGVDAGRQEVRKELQVMVDNLGQ